ncbi:hypothetical protein MY11210_006191 [Beauveria gryllotalpidicola]
MASDTSMTDDDTTIIFFHTYLPKTVFRRILEYLALERAQPPNLTPEQVANRVPLYNCFDTLKPKTTNIYVLNKRCYKYLRIRGILGASRLLRQEMKNIMHELNHKARMLNARKRPPTDFCVLDIMVVQRVRLFPTWRRPPPRDVKPEDGRFLCLKIRVRVVQFQVDAFPSSWIKKSEIGWRGTLQGLFTIFNLFARDALEFTPRNVKSGLQNRDINSFDARRRTGRHFFSALAIDVDEMHFDTTGKIIWPWLRKSRKKAPNNGVMYTRSGWPSGKSSGRSSGKLSGRKKELASAAAEFHRSLSHQLADELEFVFWAIKGNQYERRYIYARSLVTFFSGVYVARKMMLWDSEKPHCRIIRVCSSVVASHRACRAWKLTTEKKEQLDGQYERVTKRKREKKDDDERRVKRLKRSPNVVNGVEHGGTVNSRVIVLPHRSINGVGPSGTVSSRVIVLPHRSKEV